MDADAAPTSKKPIPPPADADAAGEGEGGEGGEGGDNDGDVEGGGPVVAPDGFSPFFFVMVGCLGCRSVEEHTAARASVPLHRA